MPPFVDKLLSMPLAAKLLLAINIGSLCFALTMQYGFDVYPCILCLWQRVPYAAVAVLSLALMLWKPYGKHTFVLLCLAVAAYLAGAGVAAFHTGVEQHWWEGTSSCSIVPIHAGSAEDLRRSLLETVLPPCDKVSWTLFGLSMTNWNFLASLGLAFLTALMAAKRSQPSGE